MYLSHILAVDCLDLEHVTIGTSNVVEGAMLLAKTPNCRIAHFSYIVNKQVLITRLILTDSTFYETLDLTYEGIFTKSEPRVIKRWVYTGVTNPDGNFCRQFVKTPATFGGCRLSLQVSYQHFSFLWKLVKMERLPTLVGDACCSANLWSWSQCNHAVVQTPLPVPIHRLHVVAQSSHRPACQWSDVDRVVSCGAKTFPTLKT